ncbi:MAG TPA: diaminopimelate decarboxylase [Lentisphaeria bacterium]|nr:diaminopimelate decarboxylase [Lentisphaeria bacterium]HCG27099.1 diaminopimelate decarboxylase [Lentisphaeria bacterium]HCG50946.1 diaminopimelate decarboxylase [Lentisphaeria bacterium]
MKFIGDKIAIGEIPAADIAAKFGTPTYVYDEQKIRKNYRRAFNAFAKHYPDFKMFYAVKSCNNPAIVNILRQEGAGVDAASVNEILLAKHVGLGGEDVMFSGNFLSDDDIRQGLESGVIFNLDDISLLPRLLKFGKPEILSFRVNPGYGKSNVGEFVTNAGPNAKFGIHPDKVMEAYKLAKEAGIKRFGAHMMTGSCITDAEYFPFVTGLLMDIIGKTGKELKIDFEFIDLGGGLGIPYKPGEPALDLEKAAELTAKMFRSKVAEYGLKPPQLKMEPARYFVGNAGYLIGRVHSIKESYKKIAGTDIGMNTLARPAMYGSYHHIYVDGKEQEPRAAIGLCGQLCENTDFWVKERELPASIAEGDLVVVENAGAYGFGMSYQYNGRLRPAEVLVNGEEATLIRTREDFDDMIRHTFVPSRLKS